MQLCAQWGCFASTASRTRVYEHGAQQDSHKLSHANRDELVNGAALFDHQKTAAIRRDVISAPRI